MTRPDLTALTTEVLVTMTNRGLVKRAAAQQPSTVDVDGEGTVRGRFDDGAEVTLPAGDALDAAACTCAAQTLCRHLLAVVLDYQRRFADTSPVENWSPGSVDDDRLAELVGARNMGAARRAYRVGYLATVFREPARVELPTSTVRFLVPGDVGRVHTDAANRGESLALAVWAFRLADEVDPQGAQVRLEVGGRRVATAGLDGAVELVNQVLLEGAMHISPVLSAELVRMQEDLVGLNLHWPAVALADLVGQLDAYRDRDAGYRPERVAELITEIHARSRATGPRSLVLGTEESAQTPLRRARFVSLGCWLDGKTTEIFLAHPDSRTVLLMRANRTAWTDSVAAGNVVSDSMVRSASRVVRAASNRVTRTTVTPVGAAWGSLPEPIIVRDLAAVARAMDALPPRLVRPRIEAESVHAVEVADVVRVGYSPGAQRLDAMIADAAGNTATVSAEYTPSAPGALEALAEALRDSPRVVSGSLRRSGGGIVLRPLALLTATGVVVPHLAPGNGSGALPTTCDRPADPRDVALDNALAVCGQAAHRGLLGITGALLERIELAAGDLARVGLTTAAKSVSALATALAGDDPGNAVSAWVATELRLITTAERR